jgi:hypothetical protein
MFKSFTFFVCLVSALARPNQKDRQAAQRYVRNFYNIPNYVLYIVPEKCDRWITKSPVSIKM